MSSTLTELRPFTPGTTGWTARDLDDPEIERKWDAGRYEIVEGVLTSMPPAYFDGGENLVRIIYHVMEHIGLKIGGFATEVDIIVDDDRVVRADAVFMTRAEKKRQKAAALAEGRNPKRTRILIPPTLIIESISPGHERHDEKTKRRWYAEFGVPNYWLLNPFKSTLRCLALREGLYVDDASGQGSELVEPSMFPGLVLNLAEIFEE